MEFIAYWRILNRRKWVILATALTTFIVVLIGRELIPVKYETSAVMRVIPYSNSNPSYTQLAYADRIMKTYVEIGASSVVMTNLRAEIGLTIDQPLAVDIRIIPDTELLSITVSDYDPVIASNVANALVTYLVNDKSIRDVRLTLLEPATIPKPPSILFTTLFFVVAALTGMLGGIGMVFLLESIDTRLFEERQLENLSALPILGRIPMEASRNSWELLSAKYPYNHSFRRLVANLLTIAQDHQLRTIMVTSPNPLEGKSMVAANLACSLAQAGYKTLLMDLDLYRPTLHNYFEIPNNPGLSDLLLNIDSLPSAIIQTKLPLLWVIPSGSLSKRSEEAMMNSEEIARFCGRFAGQYDFVILDSPAFLQVADGMMLSPLVDGILVVVRLGSTREPALRAIFQQLAGVQANIIGLVVNAVENDRSVGYYQTNKKINFINNLLPRKWRPENPITIEPKQLQISPIQIENTHTPIVGLEKPTRPARRRKERKNKFWQAGSNF